MPPFSNAEQCLHAAMQAAQNGNMIEAEQQCQAALQMSPNHPDALHMLGKIAQGKNAHSQALAYFEQSLRVHPDPNIFISKAMLHLRENALSDAISDFENALQLSPDADVAIQGLKQCAEQGNLHSKVRNSLAQVGTSSPNANVSVPYFQLYQHEIDSLLTSGEIHTALQLLVDLIQQANFLPVSFLSAVRLIEQQLLTEETMAKFNGIDEVILLAVEAMGYLLSKKPEQAEKLVPRLFERLGDYLQDHPNDNRPWRLLSIATGIYQDKAEGNKFLRTFLGALPDNVLSAHLS